MVAPETAALCQLPDVLVVGGVAEGAGGRVGEHVVPDDLRHGRSAPAPVDERVGDRVVEIRRGYPGCAPPRCAVRVAAAFAGAFSGAHRAAATV
jgi:hypothetical protein